MTGPAHGPRRRGPRAILRRLGGTPPSDAPVPAREGPAVAGPAQRILRSGLFDRVYYELQTGRVFGSDEAAVKDYQKAGRRVGLSPHPLFEADWFRPKLPQQRSTSILTYLDEGGGTYGPGPLFDEDAYLARHPGAGGHPGGALGHFVETAEDTDLLPVPPGRRGPVPTWQDAKEIAYAAAREFRRQEDLRSRPRRGPWDEATDAEFVRTWLDRPQDVPATGAPPSVTVVMPVRNRPVQVVEAIASIQAQTFQAWELVVVDDGSTDHTAEVLDELAAADPRIRVVRSAPSGVSAARNTAIDAARGRWLAFLDSDNTWVPHFLQVMVAYLEANDLGAGHAVVDTMVEPSGEAAPGVGRYLNLDAGIDHLRVRNHIDLNSLVVRTGVAREAGSFDPSLRRWVDHDFALRVAPLSEIRLVPFVGVRYDHRNDAADRITTMESDRWEWVVLAHGHLDWDRADLAGRVAGRVSVCIPTVEDWDSTRTAVDAVLDAGPVAGAELEIIVLVNGSRRSVGSVLHALYDREPSVRIVSVPRNLGHGAGAGVAFLASTGEKVIFLDNDTEVLPDWLAPLLAALEDESVLGCQALLVNPDGSVWSAGLAFLGGARIPARLLAGHPVDDARRVGPISRTAVSANALAMRASDVVGLRGFDPVFVNGLQDADLCLRAVDGGQRRFLVVTDSLVMHRPRPPARSVLALTQENRQMFLTRWGARLPAADLGVYDDLGLQVAHLHPGDPVQSPGEVRAPYPVVVRNRAAVDEGAATGEQRLRWALKTSVPLRAVDTAPVDIVVADGLATALRRLGQDVVIDSLEANQRPSDYLDDVTVALRGPEPLIEVPGRTNLVWLLGSCDLASAEAARYDGVYAFTGAGPARVDPTVQTTVTDGPHDFDAAARLLLDHASGRSG